MNMPLVLLNRRRRGFTAFSPSTLFALSEPGVWFDPSDLTTLFQDPAGTTPVTAPGQTVGLMLDKSRGGVGTNGASRRNLLTFSEQFDAGVWLLYGGASKTGTNIAVAPDGTTTADGIRLTTAGTGSNVYQQPTYTVAAVPYTFSCWVKRNAASDQTFQLFNNLQGAQVSSGNLTATDTWQRFSLTSTSNAGSGNMLVGIIGNTSGTQADVLVWGAQLETGSVVTAYQPITADWASTLPGNHATQATLAARPTYSIEPVGGRRNRLLYSEQFNNAVFTPAGVTVSPDTAIAPDGTLTADQLIETAGASTHIVYSGVTGFTTTTISIMAKANARSVATIACNDGGFTNWAAAAFNLSAPGAAATAQSGGAFSGTSSIIPLGNDWYRCVLSVTSSGLAVAQVKYGPANVTNPTFGSWGDYSYTGVSGSGIYIWGAQLELGSTASPYQRVTTQYDVTEAGVASVSYLYFDGASDNMVTSTITPGTDKAQVFAGVRKLSDATGTGIVAELSVTSSSNSGTFALYAPYGFAAPNGYGFRSRGTISSDSTTNSQPAPVTNVLTGIGDIAGDNSTLRLNGTQSAQITTDQGTGNYLAYPLYLGGRGGTSLFLTGHIYSLVVRFGANLDAPTITSTEIWVAGKTGIVI